MPKAKPVSLYPLSFDDALKALINVDLASARITAKRTKASQKKTSHANKSKY